MTDAELRELAEHVLGVEITRNESMCLARAVLRLLDERALTETLVKRAIGVRFGECAWSLFVDTVDTYRKAQP
jgi:hypothetical protein